MNRKCSLRISGELKTNEWCKKKEKRYADVIVQLTDVTRSVKNKRKSLTLSIILRFSRFK